MKTSLMKFAAAAVAVLSLGAARPAFANVTYSYSGHDFASITDDVWLPVPGQYTTAMQVSGWLELANPIAANADHLSIAPLAFSFSDDRSVYTNLDSVLSTPSFVVSTDGAGNIVNWIIGVERFGTGNLWTVNAPGGPYPVFDYGAVEPDWTSPTTQRDNAVVYDNPGTWTASAVPEPRIATLMLAGLGLLGFATARPRTARARRW